MKVYYLSKEDVVSFGNYLLSKQRVEDLKSTSEFDDETLNYPLNEVTDADLANWLEKQIIEW